MVVAVGAKVTVAAVRVVNLATCAVVVVFPVAGVVGISLIRILQPQIPLYPYASGNLTPRTTLQTLSYVTVP